MDYNENVVDVLLAGPPPLGSSIPLLLHLLERNMSASTADNLPLEAIDPGPNSRASAAGAGLLGLSELTDEPPGILCCDEMLRRDFGAVSSPAVRRALHARGIP
jgi:hypothetical protein